MDEWQKGLYLISDFSVRGACTRWVDRLKEMKRLRWIVLSKTGSNKKWIRRDQKPQAQHDLIWFCLVLLVGLGLCWLRYTDTGDLRKEDSYRMGTKNIALVGFSDVGKSHTERSLGENFPWAENVKTPSLLRVHSLLKNILLIDDLALDGTLCRSSMS